MRRAISRKFDFYIGSPSPPSSPDGFQKDKFLRKPRKIFYKIKGIPETQMINLKRFWNNKILLEPADHDALEKKHKKSLQDLLSQPYEDKAVLDCLNSMLSSLDHPYGMVVAGFGKELINSLEGGGLSVVLADIKQSCQTFSKSMAGTIFLQYKDILHNITLDDFSELCQDATYEALLSKEPNIILDYYHTKFYQQDNTLCLLSAAVSDSLTPANLEIQEKFWLVPKSKRRMPPPYCAAISVFQQFSYHRSPLAKVSVLRDTAKSICLCVEQFWDVNRAEICKGEDPSISADDLVGIFSYVIIKSKVVLLYSECEYICDFISDRNLMGESGYLVTTLQCCLMSLCTLDATELSKEPLDI